jgi:hypothetical protein
MWDGENIPFFCLINISDETNLEKRNTVHFKMSQIYMYKDLKTWIYVPLKTETDEIF